ncbi:hypothetical protein KJ854_00010 [Patescibacteria group bacterium]|nr:hypothetical protein [Patescibacteria group bacterium]MBU4141757.1 hypothetical protein [Patescibacteria group bacterium]
MSTLEIFFGSKFFVRILKLFIQNSESVFTQAEVGEKVKGKIDAISKTLRQLSRVKFIISKNTKGAKKYQLNQRFLYLPEIKKLVLKEAPMADNAVSSTLKKISEIKFAAVGGVLLGNQKGSVDLLAVSDKLNKSKFKKIIENLEAEIGQEVNFTLMDSKEFLYRFDLYDKFIMAMLEEPNMVIVNKMKLEEKEKDRRNE